MLKAIVRRGDERLRVRSVPRVLRSVPRAQTLCADRTMGEGAKRSKVSEVLFCARRRATARSATRSAARRSSINFGRAGALLGSSVAFGSGCGEVSASGGVARRRRTPRPQAAAARAAAGHGGPLPQGGTAGRLRAGRRPPPQGGRRCRAGPQAAAAGRPQLQGGRRRPQATRVSTIACLLPRGEAEEARRDLGGN